MDVVEHDFSIEALGVLQQPLHQLRALNAHRIAGPVLDVGGGHQLTALLNTGDQHRLQIGAGGIDRSAVTGRAGTNDQDASMLRKGHGNYLR